MQCPEGGPVKPRAICPRRRPVWSRSLIEEIIACLWTLIAIELWRAGAGEFWTALASFKAAGDHLQAIWFALEE